MTASQSSGLALTGVRGLALIIFCAPASMVLNTSMDTGTLEDRVEDERGGN